MYLIFNHSTILHVSDLKETNGVYKADVINGVWLLEYDSNQKILLAKDYSGMVVTKSENTELSWLGDAKDFEDAKEKYESGEPWTKKEFWFEENDNVDEIAF